MAVVVRGHQRQVSPHTSRPSPRARWATSPALGVLVVKARRKTTSIVVPETVTTM